MFNHHPLHLSNINSSGNKLNSNTTSVEEIAMAEMDEEVALAMAAGEGAVVQAVAEAVAVGLDTSNPERPEHATSRREWRTPTSNWNGVLQT